VAGYGQVENKYKSQKRGRLWKSGGKACLDSGGLFSSSSPPDPPWLVRNNIGLVVCIRPSSLIQSVASGAVQISVCVAHYLWQWSG